VYDGPKFRFTPDGDLVREGRWPVVLRVSGHLPQRVYDDVPRWYRWAYRELGTGCDVLAPRGLHLLLRLWNARTRLYHWAAMNGFLDVAEGDYYSNGHWFPAGLHERIGPDRRSMKHG
jgi:hypothetical protein